jgi:hypothetical protein
MQHCRGNYVAGIVEASVMGLKRSIKASSSLAYATPLGSIDKAKKAVL